MPRLTLSPSFPFPRSNPIPWFATTIVALGLMTASFPANAIPISPTALFLAPSLVPTDDYTVPTVDYPTGRTFSTESNSLNLSFTQGSAPYLPGGSTLTSVRILPLLNPNPSRPAGNYTVGDLAAINAGNFSTYFFRTPGTDPTADYWADLDSNVLNVYFNTSGQYFMQIDYVLGGSASSTEYFHVEVGDFFGGDGAADRAGVSRRIDGPTTDFNVVSTRPAGDNAYADNAAAELTNRLGANRVSRAGTLQEACDQIKAASQAAGRKISVSLVGHGRPGSIRIGTQRINNDGDGTMTPTQFQKCIDKYVTRIEFWSCNTAEGNAGTQFLREFARSLNAASGFTVTVTAARTYWDTRAGTKGLETVPEPASMLLLLTAMALCAGGRLRYAGFAMVLGKRRGKN